MFSGQLSTALIGVETSDIPCLTQPRSSSRDYLETIANPQKLARSTKKFPL